MALSKTVETPQGFVAIDAYHRVVNVSVTKADMAFHLFSYVQTDKQPFSNRAYFCLYDVSADNPIRQAYLYLKTLPEWADAVDV